jgi:PAS domain S-box-containing protein
MKDAKPTSPDARVLRQQAERKLREQSPLAEQPSSEIDARALVHELQVHQIELEMQNEELRRAGARAQEALDKYTDLFDFAPLGYFQLTQDGAVREANLAGAALRESEARYRTLFNTIDAGFCIIEMIFDAQGKPVDYRILEVNAAFEKQTGLQDAQGKSMRELVPAHEAHWFEIYGKIALTGEAKHFVNEARQLNRWYDVYAYRVGAPESRQVAILFNDISKHKGAELEIQRRVEELRAANEELVRFNRVTVGRELRIIELKKQVNELCARLGQPPRYATEPDEAARPKP